MATWSERGSEREREFQQFREQDARDLAIRALIYADPDKSDTPEDFRLFWRTAAQVWAQIYAADVARDNGEKTTWVHLTD